MTAYTSFWMAIALSCLMIHSSQAQNSPQDYVRAHNAVRAQVGVGPMRWNANLSDYAMRYALQMARTCNLIHSNGPYGENLAMGSGSFTGLDAVSLWVNENQYYNYNSNSCAQGKTCGHYTQVVWRNTVRVGCARVRCNNGNWFIICSYSPPGNFRGQRPY